MTRHVSEEQVTRWLDDAVVRDVTRRTDEETEFNLQLELSRLPIHVIKERTWGPLRIVGRTEFDSDRARELLRDDRRRGELLRYIGPTLAATPGFYTFLDEEETACELRDARSLQVEYRIYPDEASQQAVMDAVMSVGSSMKYVRGAIVDLHSREA